MKEYPDRNWTFSKLKKPALIVSFFTTLFSCKCPKCKEGNVRYIGDDWTGSVWISVYECKKCKSEFI